MMFSSFELSTPEWLWLLPLPLLVYWLVPAYRTKRTAIKVPFFNLLIKSLGEDPSEGATQLKSSWWQRLILCVSWLCIVIALTQPKMLGKPQVRESLGRDVMVEVDLSGSMSEQDFKNKEGQNVNRLEAAKSVLRDFVKHRDGDRLGLILFGDSAFIQTPFTADHQAWLTLLDQTQVAMAGESTALGDAIGLSIKSFESDDKQPNNNPERQKVVIVLTDGNDTASFVEPEDAAKVAAAKGVRIHVIAMGDPNTVGEQALDMDVIDRIAKDTGGQSFEAKDSVALQQAYDDINKLEPKLYESTTYRPKVSLQHYFVMVVVCLYLLAFTLMTIKRIRSSHKLSKQLSSDNKEGGYV
ncbi:VWA domain-containing protein [Vibrio algivorus]|uniref:VWA domain-containing protein n=1 Tax=Vibrio algivorus TaxID=1667024 RepID=A0A557P0C0_9VIBR|nr:VWA domain-containing protein [Vibrio algivorus]TVO34103.1 VWA domain-containing protein [Vibrio algivorus]